jgi:zinc and cadmium transporter
MNTILQSTLAQGLVLILPIILLFFLPQNMEFFQRRTTKAFGIGLYLSLIIILLKESFENSISLSLFVYFVGILFSIIIGKFITHHHHDSDENHLHNKKDVVRILTSDFLHNIVDGVVIVAGFSMGTKWGIMSTFGVLLHQLLQQIGQQVLLVSFHVKPKKAIIISLIIGLSIFISLFVPLGNNVQSIFMALSAGIVSVTVFQDLNSFKVRDKASVAYFLFGFLLMIIIIAIAPHVHADEDHANENLHTSSTNIYSKLL